MHSRGIPLAAPIGQVRLSLSGYAAAPDLFASLVRCVCALQICLIHVSSPAWWRFDESWVAGTVYLAYCKVGTPGFLMLAGALLIPRVNEPVVGYVRRRLARWLPLVVGAQALYLGWRLMSGEAELGRLVRGDLVAPAWYSLWFFYALAAIYVAIIPMRRYARWAGALGGTASLLALWLPVAGFVGCLMLRAWQGGTWGDLTWPNIALYCGYAWTGHVLRQRFPRGSWAGLPLIGIGATATIVTAIFTLDAQGMAKEVAFHRCAAGVALTAVGQYLVLLRVASHVRGEWAAKALNALAGLTLGIYIVHPLLLTELAPVQHWLAQFLDPWARLLAAGWLLFALAGLVTWAWQGALRQARSAAIAARGARPVWQVGEEAS